MSLSPASNRRVVPVMWLSGATIALLLAVTVLVSSGTASALAADKTSPAVTSMAPAAGPVAGGTTLTLTGSGFDLHHTVVTIGTTTVPPNQLTVSDDRSELTFATPPGALGSAPVKVTSRGGAADSPAPFTYLPVPTDLALTPSSGAVAGGTAVTISGGGFVAGATTVSLGGAVVAAPSVTVTAGGTSLSFISPARPAGPADAVVTTPGGAASPPPGNDGTPAPPLRFTYLQLTPPSGPIAGGTVVTVTGNGFVPALTTATVSTTVVPAGLVTVTPDGTSLSFVTPAETVGTATVTIATRLIPPLRLQFSYRQPPTALTSTPASGPIAGGTAVTVVGTDFVPGWTSVSLGSLLLPPASVTVTNDGTRLGFVTPAAAGAPTSLVVTTPGGSSTTPLTFTYFPPTPPPPPPTSVTTTTTTSAPTTTQTSAPSSTTTTATTTTTVSARPASQLATAALEPNLHSATASAPTATGISPAAGTSAGGTTVTISGSGFVVGHTTVKIGAAQAAVAVAVSGTSLAFLTPAVATAGAVAVTVTTAAGTTSPPLSFVYVTPVPTDPLQNVAPVAAATTTTVVRPAPVTAAPAAPLAFTGFDSTGAGSAALLVIGFGAVLVALSRRTGNRRSRPAKALIASEETNPSARGQDGRD